MLARKMLKVITAQTHIQSTAVISSCIAVWGCQQLVLASNLPWTDLGSRQDMSTLMDRKMSGNLILLRESDTDLVGYVNNTVLSQNTWVFLASNTNSVKETILGLEDKLEINSQVFCVTDNLTKLVEVYSTGNTTVIQSVPLHTEDNYIWDRRTDLRGAHFRVGYSIYKPDTLQQEKWPVPRQFFQHSNTWQLN